MPDIWSIGPAAAAFGLRVRGFSLPEADRLAEVLRRDALGEFAGLTTAEKKRLLFICWLVDHRRLGDGQRRGWLTPSPAAASPTPSATPARRVYERSAA